MKDGNRKREEGARETSTNAVLCSGGMQYNRWHVVQRIDLNVHIECAVDGYVVCTGARGAWAV